MSEHIYKLFSNYDRAWSKLVQRRDLDFPKGSKVYDPICDVTAIVTDGSLYADQVNTNRGHMGWRRLQLITRPGVEK